MKLPPAALTAPSLCPRCDSPAILTDYCVACALPLRRCGSCQGVAGPFDRFCGFCGYELVQGERRPPIWRLWLLAALVPLAAGLAIGVSPIAPGLVRGFTGGTESAAAVPGTTNVVRSNSLRLQYAIPKDWTGADGTGAGTLPVAIATSAQADRARVLDAGADLLQVRAEGPVVTIARPPASTTAVDPADPTALLGYEVALVVQSPPAGSQVTVVRAVHPVTIGGRRAAEAVLRFTRDGQTYFFERAWIPSADGLVRADAVAPEARWTAGDDQRIEAVITSIRG